MLLSVYTSLLGGMKEDEFLKYFVLDIFNQNFDMGPWEVVVASSDGEVLSEFRDLITLSRTCIDTSLSAFARFISDRMMVYTKLGIYL